MVALLLTYLTRAPTLMKHPPPRCPLLYRLRSLTLIGLRLDLGKHTIHLPPALIGSNQTTMATAETYQNPPTSWIVVVHGSEETHAALP